MRIVEQTPTKLKLRQRPIWWLFGIWFIAYGIYHSLTGSGLSTMELSTLTCQRVEPAQVSCELVASNIFGSEVKKISLNQLHGAKVEKAKFKPDSDDDASSYRVVLLTRSGKVPFTFYPNLVVGYQAEEAIASRINTFLNNPKETSLRVQEDHRWFIYILVGFFALLFFLLIGLPTVVTCTLDKTLGRLTIQRRNCFGAKVSEHSIEDITDVEVEEYNGAEDTTYRISFVLTSGDRVPITHYYSSGWKNKQEWAKYIRNFLNLGKSTRAVKREKSQATDNPNSPRQICPLCKGSKEQRTIVQTGFGKFRQVLKCPMCNGTGLISDDKAVETKGA